MSQIEPDQADFLLRGVYLPALMNEHRITKSIVEAIPHDMAWHIVVTEMRFLDALPAGAFDFSPKPRPDSIRDSAPLELPSQAVVDVSAADGERRCLRSAAKNTTTRKRARHW